jgi:hypothetical protein
MPKAARKPRRHAGEHDLIEAFDQPGCPVCRLATEAVDAYLTSVCYEQVNDLDLREQLRSVGGGFCRSHAERFLQQRHGQLAAAIVYRDVLSTARKRIVTSAGQRPLSKLAALLGGRRGRHETTSGPRCPGCEVEQDAERRYLGVLVSRLRDERILERYRANDGLCVPHLGRALESDDAGARILADAANDMLTALVGELDEYIRKHDYRFQQPFQTGAWDGGEDTPERAVERAVGHRPPPGFVP